MSAFRDRHRFSFIATARFEANARLRKSASQSSTRRMLDVKTRLRADELVGALLNERPLDRVANDRAVDQLHFPLDPMLTFDLGKSPLRLRANNRRSIL